MSQEDRSHRILVGRQSRTKTYIANLVFEDKNGEWHESYSGYIEEKIKGTNL